jgi:hypothetical protein
MLKTTRILLIYNRHKLLDLVYIISMDLVYKRILGNLKLIFKQKTRGWIMSKTIIIVIIYLS